MTEFVKYQGTGNDFILIDARAGVPHLDVKRLCDRRFGIGADGLMFLTPKPGFDFEMVYYNSDGNISSMCGNGGRCIAAFAHSLGLGKDGRLHFLAVDGPHRATVSADSVDLGMIDVSSWEQRSGNVVVLNTGSPHYVQFAENAPSDINLLEFARQIRYNDEYQQVGINVNLVQQTGPSAVSMRTYERGVEDETLSCGTGVTAAALSLQIITNTAIPVITVQTPGGILSVKSSFNGGLFCDVVLSGPAKQVFKGSF